MRWPFHGALRMVDGFMVLESLKLLNLFLCGFNTFDQDVRSDVLGDFSQLHERRSGIKNVVFRPLIV